jgi:hypothetical protein
VSEPVDWPLFKEVHELNLNLTERSVQIIEQLCEFGPTTKPRQAQRQRQFRPGERLGQAA